MRLVVTDSELNNLGNQMGITLVDPSAEELWDHTSGVPVEGLVYLRNLSHPDQVTDPWQIYDEILLVKTLSLMSDLWDIPLVVVVWGSSRVMPTNSNGVWWATIENSVHARLRYVLRTNGLFGPDIQNDVHAALLSEKPTFDRSFHISPLWQGDLSFEVDAWLGPQDLQFPVREQGPFHSFVGSSPGAAPASWYDIASGVIVGARPWESARNPSLERYKRDMRDMPAPGARYSLPQSYARPHTVRWDASWQTPKHDAPVPPHAEAYRVDRASSWLGQFAAMAKNYGHDLVNGVEDLLFA
jgi:hypothetical protein